ncbi:hypothetical protein [Elstera cyanobacteriorum]|uniref:hypothetical protein n=1 Tax=Elstera cyanobacteriorum TaxID=2022747 RepID=UPI0023546F39|nr:hypothetical protein [Elstera cyanobacteriorum]MCK6442098.1 hypothetical protein [Elstera cyanobacteriorum]
MTNPPPRPPAPKPTKPRSAAPDPKALIEGFNRVILALEASLATLHSEGAVDLAGLDDEIERLCRATMKLTGPSAEPVLARMGAMTDILEKLSLELRDRMAETSAQDQVEAKAKHRAASSAYRKPEQGEG